MKSFTYRNRRSKNYFEGWYTRLLNKEENINLAIIIAVTKNAQDPHAFIQVYDGVKLTNEYHRFDVNEFSYENGTVIIEKNHLSPSELYIDVQNMKIDVSFHDEIPLSTYFGVDSAMSYMKYFPLVCFQEVNLMDGTYTGWIQNEKSNGTIYMEKTYGYKFPKKWMWIQSNQFDQDVKLSMSCGYIPIFGFYQKGFFAVVMHKGKTYQFGSFNLSRIKIEKQSNGAFITIKRGKYKVKITATNKDPVVLVGPRDKGLMTLDVFESINAEVTVSLYKGKKLIFNSHGTSAGFEDMY